MENELLSLLFDSRFINKNIHTEINMTKKSNLWSSVMILMAMLLTATVVSARKPAVYILATGGTIAGEGVSATQTNYTAGKVGIDALLKAVPQVNDIADVTGEQIVNIGSQDMNDEVWLLLANRVNELLAMPQVDGIVITHGTDTMEETAFFLNLTVKSTKPVILTGAMRSSTAMSADGPLNLYNAVVAAASAESHNKGVMIAMNGLLLGASGTLKMNTVSVETFQSPNAGALGYIFNGQVFYQNQSLKKHTVNSDFDVRGLKELPKVGIVYSYSNIEADMVEPMLTNGYKGIIHAGVGNGNIHRNVFPVLEKAVRQGIVVVRSSRVPEGPTTLDAEVDDSKYHFVASQGLNPQKARVLLMLALTRTDNWNSIQEYFNQY